jgi:hypothetical protein
MICTLWPFGVGQEYKSIIGQGGAELSERATLR